MQLRNVCSFAGLLACFVVVVGCSSGKDEGKPVPKPDPIAQIPGAAEIQLDDSVLVEKDARVRARIDRASASVSASGLTPSSLASSRSQRSSRPGSTT